MRCKKCGQALGDGTKICPICKTVQDTTSSKTISLEERQLASDKTVDMQKREGAGKVVPFQAERLEKKKNVLKEYPYEPRSKVVAGLLQIFLGGFGIGRFYLGYNGIALGQLFTMPLFFVGNIWGIIDGILILCGQVPYDANGVPLK